MLENQRLNSRAIRQSGSHDNSAQIADACLADFSALDLAFDDLVNEVDEAEAADETERALAIRRRAKSLECVQKLNDGEVCEIDAPEPEGDAEPEA